MSKRGIQYSLYEFFSYRFFTDDDKRSHRWYQRKVFHYIGMNTWLCKATKKHKCAYPPGCRALRKQEAEEHRPWMMDLKKQHEKYGGSIVRMSSTVNPYKTYVPTDNFFIYSCCPGEHRFEGSCLLRINPPMKRLTRP